MPNISRIAIILTAAGIISAFQGINARQLSVDEALGAAKQNSSIATLRTSRGDGQLKHVYTATNDGINTIYVFNRDNGGFVILSADDVAAPVLGYSDKGSFDPQNIPASMEYMLEAYSAEISSAAAIDYVSAALSSDDKAPIKPMVTTAWDQNAPYNNLCPTMNNKRCPSGCVAVAMAQVMSYHKWPVKGTGTHTYTWPATNTQLSFDYENTPFDWDNILDTYYNVPATDAQLDAIATLMYGVGVSTDMYYTATASGANRDKTARGFVENLNYDKGLNYLPRRFYNLDEWCDLLYNELVNGRPVFYDGKDVRGSGHAFVLDGYDTDGFFHINWGWGPGSEGFYRLSALNPSSQGTGGGVSGYNDLQGAFIGIQKPVPGSTYRADYFIEGNFKSDKTTYNRTASVAVEFLDGTDAGNFYVGTYFPVSDDITLGVKLVSDKNETSYIWMEKPLNSLKATSLKLDATQFPANGTYTVTPAVKRAGDIFDVRVNIEKISALNLTATATELKFTPVEQIYGLKVSDFKQLSGFYVGKTCQFSAVISNDGDEYQGNVTPVLKDANGSVRGTMTAVKVDVYGNMSESHEWSETLSSSLTTGKYYIYFLDKNGDEIGQPLEVEILPVPTDKLDVIITDFKFNNAIGENTINGIKATATTIDMDIEATFHCNSGLWDAIVRPYVSEEGGKKEIDYAGPRITNVIVEPGKSKTYKFSKTLTSSSITADKLYYISFYGRSDGYAPLPGYVNDESGKEAKFYFCLTPAAGIEMIGAEKTCVVTPNPAETTASVKAESAINRITVYSANGSAITTVNFCGTETTEQIDVTALTPGAYLLRVETVAGQFVTRLIKR